MREIKKRIDTVCQRELELMSDKALLASSLKDACYFCQTPAKDRPALCRERACHVGVALEKAGYTIPPKGEWE